MDTSKMDEKILYKYFSDSATPAEHVMVRKWATASPENMRAFCRERNIYDAVMLSATSSTQVRYDLRTRYRRYLLRMAAIVLAVLAVGFGAFYGLFADHMVPVYSLTVPAGHTNNLLLPDGTKVWLNAGSTLTYPAKFAGMKRTVSIEGEAYLEVTKRHRPFIVNTPGGEIKVLGTKFYVTSTPEEFVVSLIEGSVSLTAGDKTATLQPGYRAQFRQGEFKYSVIRSLEGELWKDGIYYFENESFADLMKGFEKCYGVKINVDNSVNTTERYTGKFYRCDGIQHALGVLQCDFDFTYSWDTSRNTILITAGKD